MIKHFISLEWKQFKRSSYFEKGLAIKILLVLAVLYFSAIAIAIGIGLFFGLEKLFPETSPIITVNNYIIYWFLFNLAIRYFLQQLPVMNIKPLMVVPIKRNTVIYYLLGKTTLSFFNFLTFFIVIPFSIILLGKDYPPMQVVLWFLSIVFITYIINFTNFLINKNNTYFYVIVSFLAIGIGLEYYDIYKISAPIGSAFNALYNNWCLAIIPFLLMVLTYYLTFKDIRKGFYLDNTISKKVKEANATNLSWLNRFGDVAVFLKNDVKLIWRNVRSKQVLFMSFFFLFYGLFFYTQETYKEMPAILAFASMFITGGFLMTFGQLVPSWDSEYYKMLMSQNIKYKKYLESKWYLMVFGVSISFILSTPYIYFGWDIFAMIAAGALFNIGLNSFITLFGGALNRVPIELNVKAKAFSNTNGFNPTQLLISLPKIFLPMLLFYVPYKLGNFNLGLIVLAGSGILGIVFKNFFLNKIESIYQKGKYKTIAAFDEKK